MSSIIKNAKKLGIKYSASSKTLFTGSVYNVFYDNSSSFYSKGDSPEQWWQVYFSKAVKITGYTIKSHTSDNDNNPKSWVVLAAMELPHYEVVDIVNNRDTYNNKQVFTPYFTVNCKYLRIVQKENRNTDDPTHYYMYFTFFDCYGGLGNNNVKRVRLNQCYCYTGRSRNSLSYRVMLFSFLTNSR